MVVLSRDGQSTLYRLGFLDEETRSIVYRVPQLTVAMKSIHVRIPFEIKH